jgi:dTDP-4-dehydrorhamnose reductase
MQRCWDAFKPDAVLHTAAVSKANQCQQNPEASDRVNVDGAVRLARYCAEAQIPLIFTSTDLVFDGTQAPYRETDLPCPINVYGQQKAAAEARILDVYADATICRLPLLYGTATPTATCFLQDFLGAIAAGKPLTLFTDEIRTPAEVRDVVSGLDLAFQKGITGVLHLGGPQRIDRYTFGLSMATAFRFSTDLLTPCTQASVKLPTPRPQDVSMDSHKAFALGYSPRGVEAALRAIADEATYT